MLSVKRTDLPGVLVLEFAKNRDNRGGKQVSFSERELGAAGIRVRFVEEIIYSPRKAGTLYGIHFQNEPKAQTKLIYCLKGRGRDFAVDLRKGSPAYGRWASIELSPDRRNQVLIPKGFGHAFLSLEDDTEAVFRVDEYMDPALQRAISFRDPELGIPFGVEDPVLADYDAAAPLLRDSDCNFVYKVP
ncbi:MAG: dTDP-4-dehydrorhamnose 3,5-epimerase family protein [Spirochaetales bacterium]|nr:dTDP-4-dehydrorhamnose 3,5-epimerase family protein [Spirochaetales bacterium]